MGRSRWGETRAGGAPFSRMPVLGDITFAPKAVLMVLVSATALRAPSTTLRCVAPYTYST